MHTCIHLYNDRNILGSALSPPTDPTIVMNCTWSISTAAAPAPPPATAPAHGPDVNDKATSRDDMTIYRNVRGADLKLWRQLLRRRRWTLPRPFLWLVPQLPLALQLQRQQAMLLDHPDILVEASWMSYRMKHQLLKNRGTCCIVMILKDYSCLGRMGSKMPMPSCC